MDGYIRDWSTLDVTHDVASEAASCIRTTFSIGDVLSYTKTVATLGRQQRRAETSALKTLVEAVGREDEFDHLEGDGPQFERALRCFDRSRRPMKGPYIRNLKSLCRTAFRRFVTDHNFQAAPRPEAKLLSSEWLALIERFPKSTGFSPRRFASFAAANGWATESICDEAIRRYEHTLADLKHTRPHVAKLIAGWNHIAGDGRYSLQTLTPLADTRVRYAARLEALSSELQADISAYFERRKPGRRLSISDSDALPELRQESAKKSEQLLRQFIGLLQSDGADISKLKSLADVVTLDHVERVTYAEFDRNGSNTSSQLRNMLMTTQAIARHWTHMTHQDFEKLEAWVSEHRPVYDGMTPKNKDRLLMLKDRRNMKALLGLPARLFDAAARHNSERGAYLAQTAVAIELLLQTAIRIKNLSELEFDRHILTTGLGTRSQMFLRVPRDEVKNGQPVDMALTPETANMLQIYREKYLPRLRSGRSNFLFPGVNRAFKCPRSLGPQISRTVKEYTGLNINPHLFRGIAVMLIRKHRPGDMASALTVLGDRSLATLMRHYAFMDQMEARSTYQESVAREREALDVSSLGRARGVRR